MAGTIHIGDKDVWSAGTVAFSSIAERTWQRLSAQEQGLLEDAYAPLQQGFEFIALDDLNKNRFRVFCRHCMLAFEDFRENPSASELPKELFNGVVECWEDFLNSLRKDGRFDDSSCASA